MNNSTQYYRTLASITIAQMTSVTKAITANGQLRLDREDARDKIDASNAARSSTLPHAVVLSPFDVVIATGFTAHFPGGPWIHQSNDAKPSADLAQTINETVSGDYELWFDDDAREPMISFEHEGDSILFTLARNAVVS